MLDFEFPTLAEIVAAQPDARAVLAAGNYELAAKLAGECGDAELSALAIMMSGGIARGLEQLGTVEPRYRETRLYEVYGYWANGRRDAALRCLDAIVDPQLAASAKKLRAWIEQDRISVLVLASMNNARGAPLNPGAPFVVHHVSSPAERDAFLTDADALAGYDLVIAYDWADENLLDAAARAGVHCAVTSIDFDQRFSGLHAIFRRCSLILGASTMEHHVLSRIFDTRIVAYPALSIREHRGAISTEPAPKDIDVFFSGVAFVPHWPDKARILHRIAAIDNAELTIRIHNGYLPTEEYRQTLERSKYVPLTMRYGFSVNQDRTIEVLHYGTDGLTFDGVDAHWLLGDAGRHLHAVDAASLETEIAHRVAAFDPGEGRVKDVETIADFFPEPPLRDARLLKFTLFQMLFVPCAVPIAPNASDETKRAARQRVDETFARYIQTPLDDVAQANALAAFDAEIALRPEAVAPVFNKARFLWLTGPRAESVALFRHLIDMPSAPGAFDPADVMLPHTMRALSAFMPYHAHYQGLVLDLGDGDPTFPRVRAVIVATCLTYLSLDASQAGRFAEAVTFAARALDLCACHHPAAAQLAKALFAAGAPPRAILKAYLTATELYPPLIDELLPFGIDAMERLGYVDLAESHVRGWLYAVSRIVRAMPNTPAIPLQTIDFAFRYFARMPDALKIRLKSLQYGG